MSSHAQLSAITFAVILTGALPGCAAYRKCGFAGCPGDAQITAEVHALFHQHPALEPPNLLDVQTLDHVVYLYGVVDTDLEREIAESVARQAPGVAKVVNSSVLAVAAKRNRPEGCNTAPHILPSLWLYPIFRKAGCLLRRSGRQV